MHALDVIDKIARGDVYKRRLTFREGLTIDEMAQVFEEKGFGAADDFRKAAMNTRLIADLDAAAPDLEGYLFPETYSLPRNTPASEVVAQMVAGFKNAVTPEMRTGAEADGLTVRQLVTLAALVEKETAAGDERPLVSAVYRNRLRIHMPMQADPTVIYALQKAGKYNGNLTREHLRELDSPYNTYQPACRGPIAAPGRASLRQPRSLPTWTICTCEQERRHARFASTLDEHNRNVFTWQVEYFRKQRRESGTASREPAKR